MTDFEKFVTEKLLNIESRVTALETRAGVFGAVGGFVTSALFIYIKSKF